MSDPGEHLDSLIIAERGVTPPAGAREAAWSALQARLELAAAPTTAATGGFVKLAAVVGLGAIFATGVAALTVGEPVPPASSVRAREPDPDPPVPEDSPAVDPPAPPPEAAEPPAPKDSREADPPAPSPEAAEPPTPKDPGDTWTAELAALRDIHAALRNGHPGEARALADEHARRWPRGEFREEVEAARILGLCAEGRGPAARRAVGAFERRWPASLYTARLRQRCGPSSRDGTPGAADTSR